MLILYFSLMSSACVIIIKYAGPIPLDLHIFAVVSMVGVPVGIEVLVQAVEICARGTIESRTALSIIFLVILDVLGS